jgi:hypothetical protein
MWLALSLFPISVVKWASPILANTNSEWSLTIGAMIIRITAHRAARAYCANLIFLPLAIAPTALN